MLLTIITLSRLSSDDIQSISKANAKLDSTDVAKMSHVEIQLLCSGRWLLKKIRNVLVGLSMRWTVAISRKIFLQIRPRSAPAYCKSSFLERRHVEERKDVAIGSIHAITTGKRKYHTFAIKKVLGFQSVLSNSIRYVVDDYPWYNLQVLHIPSAAII